MEQNNKNVTEVTEHLAVEILKQEKERSKAKDRGVVTLGILTGISILAIVGTAMFMSNMNYKNDKEWRDLFNSYEFITQDGGGQNYYNSEIGGNANNGTTNNEAEK